MQNEKLQDLERLLGVLCELLALDPECNWLTHFQRCLEFTKEVSAKDYSKSRLEELVTSIRSVYGGMCSFNEYTPVTNTKESAAWMKKHGSPKKIIDALYDLSCKISM